MSNSFYDFRFAKIGRPLRTGYRQKGGFYSDWVVIFDEMKKMVERCSNFLADGVVIMS
jgi:hypothetical protein